MTDVILICVYESFPDVVIAHMTVRVPAQDSSFATLIWFYCFLTRPVWATVKADLNSTGSSYCVCQSGRNICSIHLTPNAFWQLWALWGGRTAISLSERVLLMRCAFNGFQRALGQTGHPCFPHMVVLHIDLLPTASLYDCLSVSIIASVQYSMLSAAWPFTSYI